MITHCPDPLDPKMSKKSSVELSDFHHLIKFSQPSHSRNGQSINSSEGQGKPLSLYLQHKNFDCRSHHQEFEFNVKNSREVQPEDSGSQIILPIIDKQCQNTDTKQWQVFSNPEEESQDKLQKVNQLQLIQDSYSSSVQSEKRTGNQVFNQQMIDQIKTKSYIDRQKNYYENPSLISGTLQSTFKNRIKVKEQIGDRKSQTCFCVIM